MPIDSVIPRLDSPVFHTYKLAVISMTGYTLLRALGLLWLASTLSSTTCERSESVAVAE